MSWFEVVFQDSQPLSKRSPSLAHILNFDSHPLYGCLIVDQPAGHEHYEAMET